MTTSMHSLVPSPLFYQLYSVLKVSASVGGWGTLVVVNNDEGDHL